MSPSRPGTAAQQPSGLFRPAGPADLRRKALARLAERIDPARSKHKPLSLVRAEARRIVDQLLDLEAPTLTRADRDRLAEDVLASAPGVGPLEELFRDEAVKEILILAPAQVIARKADAWLPTSARFRDADQVRAVLARYAEIGEAVGGPAVGGLDVKLPSGFRVLGVLPPEIMDAPPTALLVRGLPPEASGSTTQPWPNARAKTTDDAAIGVVELTPAAAGSVSGTNLTSRMTPPSAVATTPPAADPFAKLRQRLTERIVMRLAAAGIYDLRQIPAGELQRFVSGTVTDFCVQERAGVDEPFQQRLILEILAGMNRSGA